MIDTVFYFAPSVAEYDQVKSGSLHPRTISFVPDPDGKRGSIYKNKVKYSGINAEDLKDIIEKYEGDIYPYATKEKAGIIKLGDGLKVAEEDGTVDVDFSDIPSLVKDIIFNSSDVKASKNNFGVVKIGKGVDVTDGVISVDLSKQSFSEEQIALLKGDKGDDGAPGQNGQNGRDGASVTSVELIVSSTESGGKNTIAFKSGDVTLGTVDIYNGALGVAGANGKDGTNGTSPIGIDTYQINVISTTITVSYVNNVATKSGEVRFKVTKNNSSEMTSNPWTNGEQLSVSIEGSNVNTTYSNGSWVVTASGTYSGTNPYTGIILRNSSNAILTSAVVPFIISGRDGEDGQDGKDGLDGQNGTSTTVQPLNGVVTRISNWDNISTDTTLYNSTADSLGIKYLDIVYCEGYYYRLTGESLTITDKTTQEPSDTNSLWQRFYFVSDLAVQNIIALNGFIKNLTGREIVITDGDSNPVAGITSGTAVSGDGDTVPTSARGDIRIWAGSPVVDGVANLINCPFYVTNTGHLHATDAHIEGDIYANTFTAGNTSSTGLNIHTTGDLIQFRQGSSIKAYFTSEGKGLQLYIKDEDGTWHWIDFGNWAKDGVGYTPTVLYSISNDGSRVEAVRFYKNTNDGKYYSQPNTNGTLITGVYYDEIELQLDSDSFVYGKTVDSNGEFMTFSQVLSISQYQKVNIESGALTLTGKYIAIGTFPKRQITNPNAYWAGDVAVEDIEYNTKSQLIDPTAKLDTPMYYCNENTGDIYRNSDNSVMTYATVADTLADAESSSTALPTYNW